MVSEQHAVVDRFVAVEFQSEVVLALAVRNVVVVGKFVVILVVEAAQVVVVQMVALE